MTLPKDPKNDPEHIPVERRLSGDLGSPLELLADSSLDREHKQETLRVWLTDLAAQPDSEETRAVRDSIREALATLEQEDR